jgi:hypothetical protein
VSLQVLEVFLPLATDDLNGRNDCKFAHPFVPPHLGLIDLVPAKGATPKTKRDSDFGKGPVPNFHRPQKSITILATYVERSPIVRLVSLGESNLGTSTP